VRKLIIPVAAAAALAIVAIDAAPAKAQVVFSGGYSSTGYYGGYSPYTSSGGITLGGYPTYSAYQGYGLSPSYGGVYGRYPSYGGGFGQSSGVRYSPYYGGGRSAYYGGGFSGNRSGAWGGRRR